MESTSRQQSQVSQERIKSKFSWSKKDVVVKSSEENGENNPKTISNNLLSL